MRYTKLQDLEIETLEEAVRNHSNRFFRNRCQCLLSSHRGLPVKHLALIYQVRTRTIYYWFDRWETMGIVGLMNLSGQGRSPILDAEDSDLIKKALAQVKNNPIKLAKAAEGLSAELGRKVTKGMLRRLVKKKVIAGAV